MNKNLTQNKAIAAAEQAQLLDLVNDILAQAERLGASAAEVAASVDKGLSATVRLGEVETVEFNRDKGMGITVYFGQRRGSASTSDTSTEAIAATVAAACDIAKATAEDEFAGLADKNLMAHDYPDLDLYHPWNVNADQAIALAKECEDYARSIDKRLENSEGATLGTYQSVHVYGNSHGFVGGYRVSRHSLSCVLVAAEQGKMQRDYYFTEARDPHELESPREVAQKAADRTVKRLGAKRIATCRVPVLFSAETASSLLSHFLAAIQGGNLYRKSSFLIDHLGKPVFPSDITICERPHLLKGLGSAPFDAEGVVTCERDIVKDGILQGYVLSSYSARKLGMQTTGNAGGVHNLFINNGSLDFTALLKKMHKGLLVTELMGHGTNLVTGDYSHGASGFWVDNGEIQYPVEEITIASNLRQMLQQIIAVGNDVDHRGNIHTGSILIEEMMIAGE